jgi:hypothetical protein
LVSLILGASSSSFARSTQPSFNQTDDAAAVAQRLNSSSPAVRQSAAEELARLAAVDQLKLLEGYRLQESDKKVALALDWAMYRAGRTEKLYAVTGELWGKRSDQAIGYLYSLESAAPLYSIADQSSGKTLVGILAVMGRIGDEETITRINVFLSNFDPKIVTAARGAIDSINKRTAEKNDRAVSPVRDRVTAPANDPEP